MREKSLGGARNFGGYERGSSQEHSPMSSSRAALPPVWVDVVEKVETDVATLERALKSLKEAHRARLMVSFDESREAELDRETGRPSSTPGRRGGAVRGPAKCAPSPYTGLALHTCVGLALHGTSQLRQAPASINTSFLLVHVTLPCGSTAVEPRRPFLRPNTKRFLRAGRATLAPRCICALQSCGIRQLLGRPSSLNRCDARAPSQPHTHSCASASGVCAHLHLV